MNREKEQTNGERFDEFMRTVEGYPELEGTMNLCHDIIEKKTGKMTEEEWVAAERAQTGTKQETVEEAALKYLKSKCVKMYPEEVHLFIAGAKWQEERMYSEEEVIRILDKREDYIGTEPSIFDYLTNKEWFEQFKKK